MSGMAPIYHCCFYSLCCRRSTYWIQKPVCEIFQCSLLQESRKEQSIHWLCYQSLSFACYSLHIAFGPGRHVIALNICFILLPHFTDGFHHEFLSLCQGMYFSSKAVRHLLKQCHVGDHSQQKHLLPGQGHRDSEV